MSCLVIEGARQNNLKDISLEIPHNSVIAVTGLSGSGKSSLAFDTIFAEGQWRFIESLSTYARLFLEKVDRPDVDSIQNIRPAIALEQKNPVKGSRSTVGTLTEIYDLYRILYTRIARPFCPSCGTEVINWRVSSIINELLERHNGEKAMITCATGTSREELLKRGYYRLWNGEEVQEIGGGKQGFSDSTPNELVIDRLVLKDDARVADSIETAFREGGGELTVYIFRSTEDSAEITPLKFSGKKSCDICNIDLPDPDPNLFSFNNPVGACPECKGFGNLLKYDRSLIVPDESLSIAEGAIEPWEKPAASWWKEQFLMHAGESSIDLHKPFSALTVEEKELVFRGNGDFYGIDDFFDDLENRRYKLHVRVLLSRYRSPVICPECGGKRLKQESLAYRIAGMDISDLSMLTVDSAAGFFDHLHLKSHEAGLSEELIRQVKMKLEFLKKVELGYITLSRLGRTLSGGEYQRINLANQIGAHLTGTLYVLDEPTVGLHARDAARVSGIIGEIASLGNTVIVVEHDRDIMSSADWIVELGPGGGEGGGEVIFSGTKDDFLQGDTITARYLKGTERHRLQLLYRDGGGHFNGKRVLALKGARGNNLKDIDLDLPIGSLTVITGVSGSGKSSLITETLYRALARQFRLSRENPLPYGAVNGSRFLRGVKLIDQAPIGRTPRSNPVTYLKIFDHIRRLFAEQPYAAARNYKPGYFSFNLQGGRCARCKGEGVEKLEMYFFEDLYIKCEECGGRRFTPDALRVTYRGRNISEVLEMTVSEALQFFAGEEQISSRLKLMQDVALGYIKLGQPATTLSGGEAQRLKICAELGGSVRSGGRGTKEKRGLVYILDEPTTGLHFRDVIALLRVLRNLADDGNTVIVIEHNLDVVSIADWVVDLGPEGGPEGGRVVFEGSPADLVLCSESYTGRHLRSGGYSWLPD